MNSAKASVASLLRAPWNFEEDYTYCWGSTPVLFTAPYTPRPLAAGIPDTFTALDPEAALSPPTAGISPVLAKFTPCPIGSTLLFLFPIVLAATIGEDGEPPTWGYVWRVVFRLRNVADYARRKKNRIPWSVSTGRFGMYDSRDKTIIGRPGLNLMGNRYIRPAISESVIYSRPQPSLLEEPPYAGLLASDSVFIPCYSHVLSQTALYPGASTAINTDQITLDYEQGEIDPAYQLGSESDPYPPSGPRHLPKFLKCVGNEFAVECYKYYRSDNKGGTFSPGTWDFTFNPQGDVIGGEDQGFSLMLGVGGRGVGQDIPVDTGVRVISGTFPH